MTLDAAPPGATLEVVATGGPADLVRRLAEMGIRAGQQVRVLHRTSGGGRVVAVADTRIALSRAVLRGVRVAAAPQGRS